MARDLFKEVRTDIDRVRADHRLAIDQALNHIQAAISLAQAEVRAARAEFRSKMQAARRKVEQIQRWQQPGGSKRPRRDPGSALEPADPGPRPNLLGGGAEAPIE